jgi:hypothetical protein
MYNLICMYANDIILPDTHEHAFRLMMSWYTYISGHWQQCINTIGLDASRGRLIQTRIGVPEICIGLADVILEADDCLPVSDVAAANPLIYSPTIAI